MTILYATDCTKNSVPALQYVQKLSLQLKADLVILYVYDIPPIAGRTIKTEDQIQRSLKTEKQEFLIKYCIQNSIPEADSLSLTYKVEYGTSISKTILDHANGMDINLLVMGMKDEHTRRGLFSGNIANSLLNKITCKLLIVPNKISFRPIKKVLYATDFEEEDIRAIDHITKLFPKEDMSLKIVHVDTDDDKKGEEQLEWFKEMLLNKIDYGNLSFNIVTSESITLGLRKYMDDENPDIMALLERDEHNLFKKLFHKDLVRSMESQINIPLLSINHLSLK